jgi:chaperonin GroEL (HSP60 family)
MFDRGIVDPVKVGYSALLNAVALVAEYLKTDSLLV